MDSQHQFTPGLCCSCGSSKVTINSPLYCSNVCKESASYVRYARSYRSDGRDQRPDIAEGIILRLAFVLQGIYPAREPVAPEQFRELVFKRAEGHCEKCGRPFDFDPLTRNLDSVPKVHHLDGGSNNDPNLKAWCGKCKRDDAQSRFLPTEEGSSQNPYARELELRVLSEVPLRLCDDEKEWKLIWRRLSKEAKGVLRNKPQL